MELDHPGLRCMWLRGGKLRTLKQGASTRLHGAKGCRGTSTWSRAGPR